MTEEFCPIATQWNKPCWEDNCAWWVEEEKRCVMLAMANKPFVTSSTVTLSEGGRSMEDKLP